MFIWYYLKVHEDTWQQVAANHLASQQLRNTKKEDVLDFSINYLFFVVYLQKIQDQYVCIQNIILNIKAWHMDA